MNTVLFDLDGTLLDSFSARVLALQTVFRNAGVSATSASDFLGSLGGAQFNRALEQLGREQGLTTDLFISYRRAYWLAPPGRIPLFPGVKEMLADLKTLGYRLGVVTNKGRCFNFEGRSVGCVHEMEAAGISGYFDVIVGFEDVPDQKPHPLGIMTALTYLGASPAAAVMVGDSAVDIIAARAAGCLACRAAWGLVPDTTPGDCPAPDFTAATPADVVGIVKSLAC